MSLTPPGRDADDPGLGDDPCAPQRRVVEETCALTERLRAMLEVAREDLREAQYALAVHEDRQDRATHDADPREVHRRKVDAYTEFRLSRARAAGRGDLEVAATLWLNEIDEVNRRLLESRRILEAERGAIGGLVTDMEKKAAAVDRARIAAEHAAAACRQAREHLAACEEEGTAGVLMAATAGVASGAVDELVDVPPGSGADESGPPGDEGATPAVVRPRIVAILHGDEAARDVVAAALAGDDASAAGRWGELLDDLAAAIVERALEESRFVFPHDHPFWGLFRPDECREIAVAIAALGFRPLPGAGWADGRVPGRRDLSLAVGFAGQDPLRIRFWPTEAEMAALFDTTSADVVGFLFDSAADLTLGEMVALLGRRAEPLAALWNAWGRARPLLLAEAG